MLSKGFKLCSEKFAADVTPEFLRKHLPEDPHVIRVMPNTTCQVRKAMIVVCSSENTEKKELEIAIIHSFYADGGIAVPFTFE